MKKQGEYSVEEEDIAVDSAPQRGPGSYIFCTSV
jgi:hypothetical protein